MMAAAAELPDDVLAAASSLVRRRTGLAFEAGRLSALHASLLAAMRRAGTANPAQYLDRITWDAELLDDLLAEITVGETYFFRDPDQFTLLKERILPALLARRSATPLRIWSAGCASGEEPYSLAIMLSQMGSLGGARILGTDISRPALHRARQGRYSRWSLRGVGPEIVRTYFRASGGHYVLAPELRNAVEFRYLNLADASYPSPSGDIAAMDLILCRNVFIYLGVETVAAVARRLLDSLAEDGRLLLGSADPLLTELVACEVEVTPAGLVYSKQGKKAVGPAVSRRARGPRPTSPASSAPWRQAPITPPPSPCPAAAPMPDADIAAERTAEAARAYGARDYYRAAELAAAAARSHPDDPQTWVLLVRSLANDGELAGAGEACAAALDRHRTCVELVVLHAVLLAEAGRHRESAAAARRALYLDRSLGVAHLALGSALMRVGDVPGARRAFRAAERTFASLPADAPAPAADGETAGRLAEVARTQLTLLAGEDS